VRASFEPWLKAMYAAEITWSRRNRSLSTRGWACRNTFRSTTINENPISTPRTGDATSGNRTLSKIPWPLSAVGPSDAITAPISPPISAWLEDEGIPSRHVIRFHVIAPMSAAATTI
jgi:hypothetical protein